MAAPPLVSDMYMASWAARQAFLLAHAKDRYATPTDWAHWVALDYQANDALVQSTRQLAQCPWVPFPLSVYVAGEYIGVFATRALAQQHGIWQASTYAPSIYIPQPYIVE